MIFNSRKELNKENDSKIGNKNKSIYHNVNIYDREPSDDLEHDLAILIYNRITDINHAISWDGFKLAIDIYDIKNIEDYWDYMGIIKDTIINFDRIYEQKINTPQVRAMKDLINSIGRKK